MADQDLDFDVRIRPAGPGTTRYTAYVANSPAGNAETVFDLPITDVELENFLLKIGQPRHPVRRGAGRASMWDLAKSFGSGLFDAVFADEVGACLRSSEDLARSQDRRLRVRLRVSDAPILSDLPWEFLYDRRRNRFLALSRDTPVIREMDLPRSAVDLVPISPLRILVVISSPSGYPRLDTDREWTMLRSALADLIDSGSVVLERLDVATLEQLRSQLRRSSCHVLHFIGHGEFNAAGGLLIFENARGEAVEVSAEELGITLNDHRTLRLVLLNACEGARADVTNPFAGTAQQLMQQGIPAVVAMQFEITDDAAIVLCHEFYRALADGYALEEGLTEARKAIRTDVSEVEWATPVLYLRGEGGRLFTAAGAQGRTAAPMRPGEVLEASHARLAASDQATPSGPSAGLSRARRILLGARAVTEPVRRTLGPLARPVVLQEADGLVRYTIDSREAAGSVALEGLEERIGADLIRTLIDEARAAAGDGSATAAIVCEELLAGLTDLVEQGASPQALSREIESQTTAALELINAMASDIESIEQIESLVSTYAGESVMGHIVAEALDKVGKDGAIIVEESNTFGLELELTEGMYLDSGYISPHFVTDGERGTAAFSDPYILLVNATISAVADLLPLLEKVVKTGFPLVVIAQDVDGEALSTLIVNKIRETFASVAVKAPDFGERRAAILTDIAILTGASVIPEVGPRLEAAELDALGRARSVVVSKDSTTIVDAAGEVNQIVSRVNQIRAEIEMSDSDYDREKLQKRLAKLAGGTAVIKVGGANDSQVRSRRERFERAVRLAKGAVERGIVPGAGRALTAAGTTASGPGAKLALFATPLQAPLRQLAVNAGVSDVDRIVELVGNPSSNKVFDATTGQVVDAASSTVLDSADVVRTAIQSAADCARRFLSIL